MSLYDAIFSLPGHIELWLMLAYVAAVILGARLLESLAQAHFARAQRLSLAGFHYDEEQDHFHCENGARLSLKVLDHNRRTAVYAAPAPRCARCPDRHKCTPHEEARHVYRSLAEWSETDVGRFHRAVSLVMFAAASLLMLVALCKWGGQGGTGLIILALLLSTILLITGLRATRVQRGSLLDAGQTLKPAGVMTRPSTRTDAEPADEPLSPVLAQTCRTTQAL
jgi:hypothetical protein